MPRDIDVFVSPDETNSARLRAALRDVFDDPEIERISAADLAGEYPAIQYVPPESDYWIDILARPGKAFRYADVEYDVVQIEGVSVRVATPRMLYRMKHDTVHPQDRLEIEHRIDADKPPGLTGVVPRPKVVEPRLRVTLLRRGRPETG